MHGAIMDPRKVAGFTLLEALVVIGLLGLLVSLAAPAMSALRQQHRLQAQAEGLFDSLVLARSEALRRQQRVTLCARATDSSCDANGAWPQGWLVFVDSNDNAQRDAGEMLIEVHAAVPPLMRLAVTSTGKAYFPTAQRAEVRPPMERSWPEPGVFVSQVWMPAGRW